jgi:hypothetical protein
MLLCNAVIPCSASSLFEPFLPQKNVTQSSCSTVTLHLAWFVVIGTVFILKGMRKHMFVGTVVLCCLGEYILFVRTALAVKTRSHSPHVPDDVPVWNSFALWPTIARCQMNMLNFVIFLAEQPKILQQHHDFHWCIIRVVCRKTYHRRLGGLPVPNSVPWAIAVDTYAFPRAEVLVITFSGQLIKLDRLLETDSDEK